ncbi:MAG: cyclic nucleotide-binding domain-containing protein [Candidatus Dormibacteraeota bacterium]|nr:cyclic nucleotide-binding domain-containing protein [Candidatus Dormibacteraeota bacterium]
MPLLARFLHVRRAELARTLQVAGFAIVLGWAAYTAFSGTQAIFLNKAGPEAYPLFFVILALAVWPMVALQGALTRRLGVGRAFRVILALNSLAALGTFVTYLFNESATVAFAAYVVYSVGFELVMLQFWGFASQHFNLLEGKRIFPVIAAGSSIGYILAGLTTTLIALVAIEPLLLVWAFGAAVTAVMSIRLERTLYRPSFDDDADEFVAQEHVVRGRQSAMGMLRAAVQYLTSSPLVLALVLLALVLQVASRVGDYLVALIFVNSTHRNLQALTILIGNAWLASYVVQLVISLFVAPWVLDRLGVKNAILALPIFTLIGFAAVAASPVLATSLFLFVVRNGLQTGLDDPAESVLGSAVPAQVAPKLKFLLDNLVLPGAAVMSGVVLLVVQHTIAASVEVLAVIGIVVALLFIAAALRVRNLYVSAIYARLRTHAMTLSDFQRAVGRPTSSEIDELQVYVRQGDDKVRQFAAAALGRLAPDTFAGMLPELLASDDRRVRRLGFQMAPPEIVALEQLEGAVSDPDGWVVAAAAVAGVGRRPPWERANELLDRLWASKNDDDRAAAMWAASFRGDHEKVVIGLQDPLPRIRQEAIRSFAKLKADVPKAAAPMISCLTDPDIAVRREALQQALRWSPAPEESRGYAEALIDGLTSADHEVRMLAAEALAAQAPAALERTLPLLASRGGTAAATVEALVRSGRPDMFKQVKVHLELVLGEGLRMARVSARVARGGDHGTDGDRYLFLRITVDDYAQHAAESGLAAMRALHGKRGFATVERGLRSAGPVARIEGLETLLNFGPAWLAGPLAQLLDPEAFDTGSARPLSQGEIDTLANHGDRWVKEAAAAVSNGLDERMKELIALKKVPLFSTLTLEQLASIDRLMVTRDYARGEPIFTKGDVGSELFVVLEGEIRIHLDHEGREVTLARIGPSMVLGEMAVFDEQPRSASAQASADTTVRVLRRDKLRAVVHEHPEVLLEFVKNLSQRIRVMNDQLEAAGTVPTNKPVTAT